MKKKIVSVALAVIMAGLAVGSTLAWFMDTDSVSNVFTIGSIKIKLEENFNNMDLNRAEILMPIVNVDKPREDVNYVEKNAFIRNVGTNTAYVRMFIAVPRALDDAGALHLDDSDAVAADWIKTRMTETVVISDSVLTCEYNVYKYVYKYELKPEKLTEMPYTSETITGAYLDHLVDLWETEEGIRFAIYDRAAGGEPQIIAGYDATVPIPIYAVAQGVQVTGFENAGEIPAVTALDKAFGTGVPSFTG